MITILSSLSWGFFLKKKEYVETGINEIYQLDIMIAIIVKKEKK